MRKNDLPTAKGGGLCTNLSTFWFTSFTLPEYSQCCSQFNWFPHASEFDPQQAQNLQTHSDFNFQVTLAIQYLPDCNPNAVTQRPKIAPHRNYRLNLRGEKTAGTKLKSSLFIQFAETQLIKRRDEKTFNKQTWGRWKQLRKDPRGSGENLHPKANLVFNMLSFRIPNSSSSLSVCQPHSYDQTSPPHSQLPTCVAVWQWVSCRLLPSFPHSHSTQFWTP